MKTYTVADLTREAGPRRSVSAVELGDSSPHVVRVLTSTARPLVWVAAALWLTVESGWRIAARAMRAYEAGLNALGRAGARCAVGVLVAVAPTVKVVAKTLAMAVRRTVQRLCAFSGTVLTALAELSMWFARRVTRLCRPMVHGLRWFATVLTLATAPARFAAAVIYRASARLRVTLHRGWLWTIALVATMAAAARTAVTAVLWRPATQAWRLTVAALAAMWAPVVSCMGWLRDQARPVAQWWTSWLRRTRLAVARGVRAWRVHALAVRKGIRAATHLARVRAAAVTARLRKTTRGAKAVPPRL